MYPDSGYKTTHAQSVCTRPFSRGEGPGDEASVMFGCLSHISYTVHAADFKLQGFIVIFNIPRSAF